MLSKNKMKWLRSLEMKKHRTAEQVFVAEGPKVVGDLLAAGFDCVFAAMTETCGLQGRLTCEVCMVSQEELQRISFVETPQQVLAVFRQPQYATDVKVAQTELCLALDDVQNPGNLGTIIRLADWFGIEHVFCSRGCADVYNPKTVQATMGALAHVKVHYVDLPQMLGDLCHGNDGNVPVYGTFLDGDSIYATALQQRGVIVMGNEGRGVSADVERYVTERLLVPNFPAERMSTESLNVAIATAVVCAEFRRRAL